MNGARASRAVSELSGSILISSILTMFKPRLAVVRVYKGSGDRPGTPIRGQVIDRSLKYAAGDRLKSRVCSG